MYKDVIAVLFLISSDWITEYIKYIVVYSYNRILQRNEKYDLLLQAVL